MDASRAQRILASEPVFHRCGPQPQACCSARVPPTRRELFPVDCCALLAREELREPYGGVEAAYACLVES